MVDLQDAEGFNAVHHVHSMVLEMQAKHEKLVQTAAELVNEYNRREKSIEELNNAVDRLEQNKADKEHVTQEIGIKVNNKRYFHVYLRPTKELFFLIGRPRFHGQERIFETGWNSTRTMQLVVTCSKYKTGTIQCPNFVLIYGI